jgi:GrpB-like predicted nucleotidyltransferase (UPF0157 family)
VTANWDLLGERFSLEIAPCQPGWVGCYEEEADRIRTACGHSLVAIEHVGSTSVPRLAAKPILDIMPGLAKLDDGPATVEPMRRLGYEYFGEFGIPGRFYFTRSHDGRCVVHVHMFVAGSEEWQRHLVFRDYLRQHAELAAEYEALKRALSARCRPDRTAYTDGKTEFIRSVVERARLAMRGG